MFPRSDGADVPVPAPRFPVDPDDLAETLMVIGYGARLQLLNILAFPHPLGDIKLMPQRGGPENPERAMSKQGVQAHLDKLVDTGLVRTETMEVDGRALKCYVANAQRLYSLVEDLRTLCARYTAHLPSGNETGTLGGAPARAAALGPRLVLVHGVYEGKVYPLDGAGRWLIGRQKNAAVALDYDPFVSSEHAFITVREGGFRVTDAPASKNGTLLNWELLPKGGSADLEPGDVIGVGRSSLVLAGGLVKERS